MTERQRQIYNFIAKFSEENGYPPSTREIADGVSLKSTSSVHRHLDAMQKGGYIDFEESKPRTIRVLV